MTATPEQMLETAVMYRRKSAELTTRALRGEVDDVYEERLRIDLLATNANLWPWVRLSEMFELAAAGFPTGHINDLPPRELWQHLAPAAHVAETPWEILHEITLDNDGR